MPVHIPDRDDWFPERAGFPVPDWDAISAWITTEIGDDDQDLDNAWEQAWRQWIGRMQDALGPDYLQVESENFLLLSNLPDEESDRLLDDFEDRLIQADELLGRLANPVDEGQIAIFLITDGPRYREYVSLFYPEPEQYIFETGVFLEEGFPQFVLPHGRGADLAATIARELGHHLLAHHKHMPTWLDEGVAQWVEAEIAGTVSAALDDERTAAHRAYWNGQTIQNFWDGVSFRTPGEVCALSYELAHWLATRVIEESAMSPVRVEKFINEAHTDDAGEAAARRHLVTSLGDLLVPLLGGKGPHWTPAPTSWLRTGAAHRNGHKPH